MSEETSSPDSIKSIVLKEVLAAAADSSEMRRAGRSIGSAVATIAATIDHALLPLAAVNYGIQKAKDYFGEKFSDEFREKTKDIPLEHLVEPKPSIAGPALQGIAFSLDEPDLKDLYMNLLRTAVDGRSNGIAHPAFVDIIKQLKSEEARFLDEIIQVENVIPVAQLLIQNVDGGLVLEEPLLTNARNKTDGTQILMPEIAVTFNNWCRLGLVEIDWMHTLKREDAYEWVKTHPRYAQISDKAAKVSGTVEIARGIARPTTFGLRFGSAVGISKSK